MRSSQARLLATKGGKKASLSLSISADKFQLCHSFSEKWGNILPYSSRFSSRTCCIQNRFSFNHSFLTCSGGATSAPAFGPLLQLKASLQGASHQGLQTLLNTTQKSWPLSKCCHLKTACDSCYLLDTTRNHSHGRFNKSLMHHTHIHRVGICSEKSVYSNILQILIELSL